MTDTDLTRDSAFDLIRSNIAQHGQHIYLVSAGAAQPRHAYTIGLSEHGQPELVFAGGTWFSAADVQKVLNQIGAGLRSGRTPPATWTVDGLGDFTLGAVDRSWLNSLLLGALDFYGERPVQALQVLPDEDHWTLDIPDLSQPWNAQDEPVWQWLKLPWTLPVPADANATTNLDALRGYRVTEAARWEADSWELFSGAGPEVAPDDIRIVPLATLLALDPTLDAVTRLDIGRALWRDGDGGDWQVWN